MKAYSIGQSNKKERINASLDKLLATFNQSKLLRKKYLFLIAITIILLFRQFYLLNRGESKFVGDEIEWHNKLDTNNLPEYIKIKDAGYYVFTSRLIFYILVKVLGFSSFQLHSIIAIIASISCASLIYLLQDDLNNISKFFTAIAIGIYPTYDLLFWHNLSYFIFIPTILYAVKLDFTKNICGNLWLTFLILWVAKPQLLLSIASVLLLKNVLKFFHHQKNTFSVSYINIIIVFSLIAISRAEEQLPINIKIINIIYLILNSFYLPISFFIPIFSAGIVGYFKMLSIPSVEMVLKFFVSFATIWLGFKFKRNFSELDKTSRNSTIYFLLAALPIYLSFFVLKDSVLGNSIFFEINCRSCVLSRHIFPFYVLTMFVILSVLKNTVLAKVIILSQVIQILLLTVFAYEYLFSPVLKL